MKKEKLDWISKALGASVQIKLPKYEDGPLGWLHMAHDVAKIQQQNMKEREALKKKQKGK